MYAARAAATAAYSCVRREPISMHGRPAAADVIREAAAAMAESWLSTERISVSSRTPSAKVASHLEDRRLREVALALGVAADRAAEAVVGQPVERRAVHDAGALQERQLAARRSGSAAIASITRPVPATTPYRRPSGSLRAKTSKTDRRCAAPLRSAACSIVSS